MRESPSILLQNWLKVFARRLQGYTSSWTLSRRQRRLQLKNQAVRIQKNPRHSHKASPTPEILEARTLLSAPDFNTPSDPDEYYFSLQEGYYDPGYGSFGSVSATDPDGTNVIYSGGDGNFSLNEYGYVEFTVSGYLAAGTYTFQAEATDEQGETGYADVTIKVGEYGENDGYGDGYGDNQAPEFDQDTWSFNIDENTTGSLGTIAATDPENNILTYSLVGNNPNFTIDASTGALSLVNPYDYETLNGQPLELSIEVTDGDLTDTNTVQVTINDVNEAPHFLADTLTIHVDQYLENGTVIATLEAFDVDDLILMYSEINNSLTNIGLSLDMYVNSEGKTVADVVCVNWSKTWETLVSDPGTTATVNVSDGQYNDTLSLLFTYNEDFLGTTWGLFGGGGSTVAFSTVAGVAGFPATSPSAGNVTVILGYRGKHSFIVVLDDAGNMTAYSGYPKNGDLFAESGSFGVYESHDSKCSYKVVTTLPKANVTTSFSTTMSLINTAANDYVLLNNNCHSTSWYMLNRLVPSSVPSSPHPLGEGVPGWGSTPTGCP